MRSFALCSLLLVLMACSAGICRERAAQSTDEAAFTRQRQGLVKEVRAQGVKDERVLAALAEVPRHLFVPQGQRRRAYANYPLAIGSGQTISQPYIVAYMTAALRLSGSEKVLEIGTGSGYQAAVLARCASRVYSVEILPELSRRAGALLARLGYDNVFLKIGDGYGGWSEHAPYDAVIVTAAPLKVPEALVEQLREGGRLAIPVGPSGNQVLYSYQKRSGKLVAVDRLAVRFVPMTGKAQQERSSHK